MALVQVDRAEMGPSFESKTDTTHGLDCLEVNGTC